MTGTAPPRIPRSTYRLQFNKTFTFPQAAELVPYLDQLGISHLYASPYFKARAGSTHGYDITDHNELNPEVGTRPEFERMVGALLERGMGQVIDFVPNHMGVGLADNDWWLDVLEWGRDSPRASYFDIDWDANLDLPGKLVLPVLGQPYGQALEGGELKLAFDAETAGFAVWYYEHKFPISPLHYSRILGRAAALAQPGPDGSVPALAPLEEAVAGFEGIRNIGRSQRSRRERREAAQSLRHRLVETIRSIPAVANAIGTAIEEFNGIAGNARSYMALHRLLEAQSYRLAYWRVAATEINYRRFFDINDLAGLRIEDTAVFEHCHRLVLQLLAEGKLHGLRIDHIDGLFDPAQYCRELQRRAAGVAGGSGPGESDLEPEPLYVVVEKILASHESLRQDWPVAGTTGYEFANLVNGLFVDGANEARMSRAYARFVRNVERFDDMLYRCKRLIMDTTMASELTVLASELTRIAKSHWRSRDFTFIGLQNALREVVACFPVYRTYIEGRTVSSEDRHYIEWATALARKRSTVGDTSIFDFVQAALTADLVSGNQRSYSRRDVMRFAMKFQQYTGPVMAKGLEDTSFYRYFRLVSLNEVGGDPRRFAVSVNAFHTVNQERARKWPHSMLGTATHDTKRGEDTRARITGISEMPGEWLKRVRRWAWLNRNKRREIDGDPAPTANDEYLLYQTLVGAWPLELTGAPAFPEAAMDAFRSRIEEYMTKVMREAKDVSSWRRPNEAYEGAVHGFVRDILNNSPNNPFLVDFLPFQQRIARLGVLNSLSQTLLKLTSPGIPDIYQGCEMWDLSLVDPDNRRPVDYDLRRAALQRLTQRFGDGNDNANAARALLDAWPDGEVKLYTVWRALQLRRHLPDLFADGGYHPLQSEGQRAEHVCAFMRDGGGARVLVVVPRVCRRLLEDGGDWPLGESCWGDTAVLLQPGTPSTFRNLFTGGSIEAHPRESGLELRAAELFAQFPIALLTQG